MTLSPRLEADLKKLAFSVEMAAGEFTLIFAHRNYVLLQTQLAGRLGELTTIETSDLKREQRSLARVLKQLLHRGSALPPAVQVLGMEQMPDLASGLAKIDQTRDQLQTQFPLPIVVWVNDALQTHWIRHAPNMESWSVPKSFTLDDATVKMLIAIKTQQVMEQDWQLSTQEAQFLQPELKKAKMRFSPQTPPGEP